MEKKRLHYKVSEECLANLPVENGSIGFEKYCNKKQGNTFVCIMHHENGLADMCNMFPMKFNGKIYGVVYPDPIDMLIEQAGLFYAMATNVLPTFAQQKVGHSVMSSEGEEVNMIDSKIAQQIIAYRVSSLTLSIMALESFLNSNIPNDYTTIRKGKSINKSEIESKFSIKDKLTEFKTIYNIDSKQYQDAISNIQRMVNLRNDFVHIKSIPNSKNAMSDGLIKSYETIMNSDLSKHIQDVKKVISIITEHQAAHA